MPRRGRLLPETTEAFLDGHVSAFGFLGGVPQSILYDNTRLAVARILGDGRRKRTRAFTELQSHYLFEDRFGRPGKGNDKGKVEGMVGYVRRNFLVPVPSFESFDALNDYLKRRCLERMDAKLRGHTETIGQRMERDLDALLPLPPVAYDACEKQAGRVSSLSLLRYKTNDYSVPVAYGYRDVIVRGYVDRVVISCGSEIIARHPAAPPAGMGKSIPSCQGEINRVSQPPPELRQGGISSRGRKQGCFQPCTPGAGGLMKLWTGWSEDSRNFGPGRTTTASGGLRTSCWSRSVRWETASGGFNSTISFG